MRLTQWAAIVIVSMLAAACAAPTADPLPSATDTPSAGNDSDSSGGTNEDPSANTSQPPEGQPAMHEELVRQAKLSLAARLSVTDDKIEVVTVEEVVWSDASLGCPEPGQTYAQAEVPGVVIRLRVAGTFYDYHATPNGEPILCEQADLFANSTPATAAPADLGVTPQAPPSRGEALPGSDPLVQSARADLSQRTGVPPDSIEVLLAEKVTWPDGAIGCPQPGMFYTQAVVEGARVVLKIDGQLFFYHSSDGGNQFLCGENPKPIAPGGSDGVIILPGTDEFVPPPGGPDD